ncbi:MAG: sugar phosphate isomerase/epimerase [Saprospiraceae bacterium]
MLSTDRLAAADNFFGPKHVGLQLWSVRDDMNKDAAGTLQAVAKMGYREVEPFGYDPATGKIFGLPVADFAKLVKANGLKMRSSHNNFKLADYNASTKMLSDRAKKIIDVAASLGQKYIINAYLDEPERTKTAEVIKLMEAAAGYARKAGLRFGYHNHDFEFKTKASDGRMLYEWLLQEVDPKLMTMEMDIYWVCFAGLNPVDWFKKYPGRFELCHAKDMSAADKHPSIEFGDGTIDFKTIFANRSKAGLKYFIIELENYLTTPMQGVARSLKNFQALKV